MDQFKAIGISFRNTPLEIREAVTFNEEESKYFLRQCREVLGLSEIMILSTCNRTEIYYSSVPDQRDGIISMISVVKGVDSGMLESYFQSYDSARAATHLFEVALGLDSKVLGDIQISNQVKRAYQWSADEQLAGPFLHRLLHTIFFANKRVVQETMFRDGTASLASVATELCHHFIKNFNLPKVAIIGLGEIGSDVAENLKGCDFEVVLVNRTEKTAEALAEELHFGYDRFENLKEVVLSSDVIISAVQTKDPVIDTSFFSKGEFYHKMFIDLSVPRSIDHNLEEINGLLLYNIDQLSEKTLAALQKREAAVPDVKAILQTSLEDFEQWSQEMEVSPVIQKLKNALEDIRQQEMARYIGKLGEEEAKLLDQVTKNMIQKVIKLPVLQLKAACKRGEAETLVEVLNDLFNLEKDQKKVL